MARIPEKQEHQRRLMELDFKDRRAILKAVNRGRAVENRKHAVLAVGVARRQRRFWRVAWLLGPMVGVVQLLLVDPAAALANGIIGTLALGAMSAWWVSRAKRAEAINTEIAVGKRSGGSTGGSSSRSSGGASSKGHLPGKGEKGHIPGTDAPRRDGGRRAAAPDKGPRPPAPRGKKRR